MGPNGYKSKIPFVDCLYLALYSALLTRPPFSPSPHGQFSRGQEAKIVSKVGKNLRKHLLRWLARIPL